MAFASAFGSQLGGATAPSLTTAAAAPSAPAPAPSPFGSVAASAFKASVAAALSPSAATSSAFAQAPMPLGSAATATSTTMLPAPPPPPPTAAPVAASFAFGKPTPTVFAPPSDSNAAQPPPHTTTSSSVFASVATDLGGGAPPPVFAAAARTSSFPATAVAGSTFVPTLMPPPSPVQTQQSATATSTQLEAQIPLVQQRRPVMGGGGMRSSAMLPPSPAAAVSVPPSSAPFDPLGDAARRSSFGRGGGGGGRGGVFGGRGTSAVSAAATPPQPVVPSQGPAASSSPPPPPPQPQRSGDVVTMPTKVPTGSSITVLYEKFLTRLLATTTVDAAQREESTALMLDAAFFTMEWASTPANVLYELIAMTQARKPRQMKLKLERWAVVFFLGCNVSCLLRRLHQGGGGSGGEDDASVAGGWQSLLRVALSRVNILSDTFQELFVESRQPDDGGGSDHLMIPSMCVRLVLRRVRTAFETAASVGFHDIASLEAQLIGAIVRREGAGALFRCLVAPPPSKLQLIQAQTTVCIVCEYACLKSTTEMQRQLDFSKSFHEYCPDEVEMRCTLYFRNALLILQALPLSMPHIGEARELLAHALVLCPREHCNARIIARWLAAACFAIGMVPSLQNDDDNGRRQEPMTTMGDDTNSIRVPWLDAYGLGPELATITLAMHTANLALYEETLSQMLPMYLETGIAALVQYGRLHMRTAVVLRYFRIMGCPATLQLQGLVDSIGPLPFPHDMLTSTADDFTKLWLMPLLLECMINGSVVGNVLILSKKRPFTLFDIEVQA